jgi:hypothetical protein
VKLAGYFMAGGRGRELSGEMEELGPAGSDRTCVKAGAEPGPEVETYMTGAAEDGRVRLASGEVRRSGQ